MPADTQIQSKKVSPLVKMFVGGEDENIQKHRRRPITYHSGYIESVGSLSPQLDKDVIAQTIRADKSAHFEEKLARENLRDAGPLLLWSMREQLKHLHESDSETYTPKLLSFIFLVDEDHIKVCVLPFYLLYVNMFSLNLYFF